MRADPLPSLSGSSARALGAYYTPGPAARLLAAFALRSNGDRILEPSMGEGVFLDALAERSHRLGLEPDVWGVELAADTHAATVARGAIDPRRALRGDFLVVVPFPVDAVVGNPPYVRLRHLPAAQSRLALDAAAAALGTAMDPSGSLWMPFVLHATRFLRRGGRLALVLPYEATYVRYARPLWRHLGAHFDELAVTRVQDRIFPDVFQEVVLLTASGYGGSTPHVTFRAFRRESDLSGGRALADVPVDIDGVVAGERAFVSALLPPGAAELLTALAQRTVPARDLARWRIGYVCGDKGFFHPDEETRNAYDLPGVSLRSALASGRAVRGSGLRTSAVPAGSAQQLFLPPGDAGSLTEGERRYVAAGEAAGVAGRYKCRARTPWYVTPGVQIPDVVLPVFSERPVMMVNDAGLVASNSLLCGYLRQGTPDALVAAWFTSLTVLQLELQVHALGGGVMVVVPREAGNLRLPRVAAPAGLAERLHRLLVAERVDEAFAAGDVPVLGDQLGLCPVDVDVLRAAAAALAAWRDPRVTAQGAAPDQ